MLIKALQQTALACGLKLGLSLYRQAADRHKKGDGAWGLHYEAESLRALRSRIGRAHAPPGNIGSWRNAEIQICQPDREPSCLMGCTWQSGFICGPRSQQGSMILANYGLSYRIDTYMSSRRLRSRNLPSGSGAKSLPKPEALFGI